jgi:aconitate hydratase
MFLGVRAVLVKSFARIHKANLINYGIIPLVFKDKEDYENIAFGEKLVLEDIFESLDTGKNFVLKTASGKTIEAINDLDERSKAILKAGGLAAYTKSGGQ